MKITVKDTNVIVLFGDNAVGGFPELIRCWSKMLSPGQWNGFQFILVGSVPPKQEELENLDKSLVNDRNTRFYTFEDKAPGTSSFHNMIFDKISNSDTIWLHVVCDCGEKETDYNWLSDLIRSATDAEALTIHCVYYLLFGMNSPESEREQLIRLVQDFPGSGFLLGDQNEKGGRVPREERWHATVLGILMNSAGSLQVVNGVYSFGYSALNANGSELRRLCESAACGALLDELNRPVDTLNAVSEQLDLLPEGVASPSDFHDWLMRYISANVPQPSPAAVRNAWITIRMRSELAPSEAVKRMRRFADLNYTGLRNIGESAKELAWQTEHTVLRRLCASPLTASLSDRVFEEIADSFRRLTRDDIQPSGCAYPKKPLMAKFGRVNEPYERECRDAVFKSIRTYITEKNICVFAAELEKVYRRLAAWLRKVQGRDEDFASTAQELLRDIRKDLESSDSGNTIRLAQKYKRYAAELENMHPSISVLTEGISGIYYQENGTRITEAWNQLVKQSGANLEKRMPAEYRGKFFRVLTAEFSTEEERANFFDEYLSDGPRMYRNFRVQPGAGTHVLLADDSLTDQWFMNQTIHTVKTDNAENLTVYRIGYENAASYLEDTKIYFHGNPSGSSSSGKSLFGSFRQTDRPEPEAEEPRRSLFGSAPAASAGPARPAKPESAKPLSSCGLRMMPDKDNNYRLYWEWHGNDETAMVEIIQYGERVGKIAVIPIRKFKENGDNMNVTEDIMSGRQLPAGTLNVTIRDVQHNLYISGAEVQGRRDVVRYKAGGNRLELKPGSRTIAEKLVLMTTDTNGVITYYPLYAGDDEHPWNYTGLNLSDPRIVEDPTGQTGQIIPMSEGN